MNVANIIEKKLSTELTPESLVVENVSDQHADHASSPGTGQSHFNVTVVSQAFAGLPKVARFRKVHEILKSEMDGPVHALSLELKTPDEAKS